MLFLVRQNFSKRLTHYQGKENLCIDYPSLLDNEFLTNKKQRKILASVFYIINNLL